MNHRGFRKEVCEVKSVEHQGGTRRRSGGAVEWPLLVTHQGNEPPIKLMLRRSSLLSKVFHLGQNNAPMLLLSCFSTSSSFAPPEDIREMLYYPAWSVSLPVHRKKLWHKEVNTRLLELKLFWAVNFTKEGTWIKRNIIYLQKESARVLRLYYLLRFLSSAAWTQHTRALESSPAHEVMEKVTGRVVKVNDKIERKSSQWFESDRGR